MYSAKWESKALREFGEGVFSPRKNLACVTFHRNAFGVGASLPLQAFERLVSRQEGCTLESSCKVSDGEVQAARWNLFFHDGRKDEHLDAVLGFFRDVERQTAARLDYRLFREFYGDDFDLGRVRKVVTGVDLRDDWATSRLKLWFMLSGYPERVDRAIVLHGEGASVRPLMVHDEFLVGLDFSLDGRNAIKLYPDIWQSELRRVAIRRRLRKALCESAIQAMEECRWTHICVARHNPERVLHYHPSRPREFIDRCLPDPMAQEIHGVYGGTTLLDMVVSLREGELSEKKIRNYTLYYTPAEMPDGGGKPATVG